MRIRVVKPYSTADALDSYLAEKGMESITTDCPFEPKREVPEKHETEKESEETDAATK